MLEAALAAGRRRGGRARAARRRAADARAPRCSSGATASTSRPSSPPRTTPTATTGSSSSAPRARSSRTTTRLGSRRWSRADGDGRGTAPGVSASCTARTATTCASSSCASATSTSPAGACCSTARNGATYRVAPEIFRRLGAEVEAVAAEPDGRNINDGCGSTHVESLAERCAAASTSPSPSTATATACWPWTATGAVVDGDELIALAALHLREAGRLPGRRRGGDRDDQLRLPHRHARGRASRWRPRRWATATCWPSCSGAAGRSGGEQSGHIIDTGFVPAGDGIAAALLTLEALGGGDLADRDAMEKLPQRLINVRVAEPRRARVRRPRSGRRSRRPERAGGPRAGAGPPLRHRAARARDGRGARRGGVRRDRRRLAEVVERELLTAPSQA